jgi:PAT family beta-lactamase induction signal transducer AmpG
LSIKTIGIFSLVALPYNFKFSVGAVSRSLLAAFPRPPPRLDLIYQACLASASASWVSALPPRDRMCWAAWRCSSPSLSASQDIVIDAYRVDAIPPSERALAAASAAFGYRTAAMLAGAVLVYIAASLGWRLAFLFVAAHGWLTMIATIRAPEPDVPGHAPRPWPMRCGIRCARC